MERGEFMNSLQGKFLTNKITIRWLKILNILERIRPCSAREISTSTNLSSRTVIKEIQAMRNYFKDSVVISTSNMGYRLSEINYKEYINGKRKLIDEDPLCTIIQSVLVNDLKSVEEWAFRFHLSESTMKRFILSVMPVLEEYDLQISLTPVDLIGAEVNIRKFFKDFYYEVDALPHILLPFEKVDEILVDLNAKAQIDLLTNISPLDLHYFVYIMIQRSINNKSIENISEKFTYTDTEKKLFDTLKKNIKTVFKYELDESELNVLFIYCISQRGIFDLPKEKKYCSRFGEVEYEKKICRELVSEYNSNLNEVLTTYIESFLISVRWLNSIGDIMNKSTFEAIEFSKKAYPSGFKKTFQFLKKNEDILGISNRYTEDITSNLILTIEAIKDTYDRRPKNIAFLLEGSPFVNRSVQAKAFRYLRGYHDIYFLTATDLNDKYLTDNKINLFVTNQEEYVRELLPNIDFILFKTIPDSRDWNQLLQAINPQITKDFSLGETLT